MPMMRPSDGALPLIAALARALTGCAGFSDAYRDRVRERRPTALIGCTTADDSAPAAATSVAARIFVEPTPDRTPTIIGRLFDRNALDPIPVSIAGPGPNAVLADDVRRSLRDLGYAVLDEPGTGVATLGVSTRHLLVECIEASGLDLHGTVRAVIELRLTLGEWHAAAAGADERRVLYFAAADIVVRCRSPRRAHSRSASP
jgi:hypothetical protein